MTTTPTQDANAPTSDQPVAPTQPAAETLALVHARIQARLARQDAAPTAPGAAHTASIRR